MIVLDWVPIADLVFVGHEKGRHDAGDLLRGPDALVDLVGIVMWRRRSPWPPRGPW